MAKVRKKDRILVLSVDRDNDIGEKTPLKGPFVGKAAVLDAAQKLGMADPEDSDLNAIFQAVRVYNETKRQYECEVAVLTGDKNVGLHSDKVITKQFSDVLRNFSADYVVLVTDGMEDEYVMPIIQSKVPILSVSRVVVKQAEQLESSYYKLKDFVEESLENPKFARLVFGLPAISLILYATFGFDGWRAILGLLGAYLFIKGFKLERFVYGAADEMRSSFTRRRFAFFMYTLAILLGVFATYKGYEVLGSWLSVGIFETASAFVAASVYFYFLSGTAAWFGRSLSHRKRSGRKIMAVPVFGFAISVVIYNATQLILIPELSIMSFLFSILFGFGLLFLALLLEWKG